MGQLRALCASKYLSWISTKSLLLKEEKNQTLITEEMYRQWALLSGINFSDYICIPE